MTKTRKNLLALFVSFLLVFTMAILYGCTGDNKGGENCTTSGNGVIISNTDDDGIETKTAVADKWNVFMGWYDGLDKYSDKATIVIDKKTPDNLVAKFASSGTLSADRILNGAYQRYSQAIESNEDYLNYSYETTLAVKGNLIDAHLDVQRGGYLSLNGEGFNDYAVVKDNGQTLFSQYYVDDTEDAMLYIDLIDRKVAVDDLTSVGDYDISIEELSNTVWTLQNLVDSKTYSTIDGYIGFRNSVGFIGNVENSKNQTKITLNVDNLLNELKDKIAMLDDPDLDWLKNAVETLTKQYQGISNKLPKIVFEVVVDYQTVSGIEEISAVTFKGTFEENYNFELDGKIFTIPACTMSCKIENANFSLSNTPNAVPSEIISSFPEAVHAVNVHADGTLSFLKEDVITAQPEIVIDQYRIDFDADINPHFIIDAIGDDGNIDVDNIDWEELGFLSFKISLIENPEDESQASRHNGSTEYLNLLVDTKKYGAKAFVYVDLYNPKTLSGTTTSTFILKGVYEIPELVEFMPEIIGGLEEEQAGGTSKLSASNENMIVANLLSSSIKGAYNLFDTDITEGEFLFDLLMEVLEKIAPDNELITKGLSYTEFGTTLAVEEIKDLIEETFSSTDDTLSSLGLHNNIFGEKTTHIAINTDTISYGSVVKNAGGEYIDENGKVFVDEYNSAHKMLVAVADGSKVLGIDDLSYTKADIANEVLALKGKSVKIETGLFSDGTTSSTFENCQGNQAELAMRVYRAQYQLTDDNTAEITVYLSYSAGTLQSLLVNTFDIPYGLIKYTTTVSLN